MGIVDSVSEGPVPSDVIATSLGSSSAPEKSAILPYVYVDSAMCVSACICWVLGFI